MREVIKSKVFYIALSIWALFFPIMALLGVNDLYLMIGSLTFCSALATVKAYWPALKLAINVPRLQWDYGDFLGLGIIILELAISGRTFILMVSWAQGTAFPQHALIYPLAFFLYMQFTGSLLLLSARRVIRQQVPRASWPRVVTSVFIGLLLGALLCNINNERPYKDLELLQLRGSP